MFKKLPYTAGISGALYETKLISLLYFRALYDDTIEDFQIAANLDNIGHFDDICFKFKVKGFDKPVAVFIHARHSLNKKHNLKIDLSPYFTSYLKIRKHFDPNNKDLFFKGTFDETESFFVFYTNATFDLEMTNYYSSTSNLSDKLCDLIVSGDEIQQFRICEAYIEHLNKVTMKEEMTLLAKRIANIINEGGMVVMPLNEEILLRYHVILARQVVEVSEIQPDGHRIASFRYDFFDTYDEYLTLFKDTLFKEILKKSRIRSTDIKSLLSEFLTKPADVSILSKLIETVITYNNGFLEINKQYTEYFRPELKEVHVSQPTVDKAIQLAASEILLSPEFKLKVPSAFGNKDLTLRGKKEKIEKRINYITLTIIDLLYKCDSSKIVTIDEYLGDGFLQLNGGISGAIGNIFVLDDSTKLMKVTDHCEQLGPLAKSLYVQLNSKIDNLHEYKFNFKYNKFPKISLVCNNYEDSLARDFLKRLLICSNQASQDGVEDILKIEMENNQSDQLNYCHAKTDEIFLKFHDQIQKWWMNPNVAPYLTRAFNLFQYSINSIIKDPLMSSINLTYMRKLRQYNYTFTEDAVSFLNLTYLSSIIITENSELTVLKVLHHFKNKDHVVLDFEHIAHLPTNICDLLCTELLHTDEEKVLIFVFDTNSKHDLKNLKIISHLVVKTTIVVTNQTSFEIIQEYFRQEHKVIQDKKLSLIDLSAESQIRLLDNATVMFPGVDMKLDLLLRGWAKTGSRFPCVTAPRARQQSEHEAACTSQGRTASAAAAAADNETETGSRRTGEEEKNIPGTSSDPVSIP